MLISGTLAVHLVSFTTVDTSLLWTLFGRPSGVHISEVLLYSQIKKIKDHPYKSPLITDTDKVCLVMVLFCSKFEGNCLLLNSASRALNYIVDCWPLHTYNFILTFHLDIDRRLQKIFVYQVSNFSIFWRLVGRKKSFSMEKVYRNHRHGIFDSSVEWW